MELTLFPGAFGSCREGRSLCPIAADGHAAPPARVSMALVEKEKRAFSAFAGLDLLEVGRADEFGNLFRQRREQRVWLAPSPPRTQMKHRGGRPFVFAPRSFGRLDLPENRIRTQKPVQRSDLIQRPLFQRASPVLVNESSKPIPERSGIFCYGIQLCGGRALVDRPDVIVGQQSGLLHPRQKIDAVPHPFHDFVHWSRNRVEEVESRGSAEKYRRRQYSFLFHVAPFAIFAAGRKRGKESECDNRIKTI